MLNPKQSFQHTLQEISVNRDSPCELVRELVSNAVDAIAKNILVFPLLERKGLIFFDDGIGLSMASNTDLPVSPYVAFFSIGFGTKTKGEQIGYKCQGSKLCFASNRFALITRCARESSWRHITVENPKKVLSSNYDITPKISLSPEKILQKFLVNPDKRTKSILDHLNKNFFKSAFKKGTMIVIEGFEASEYEKYFSVNSPETSYLYNYIRFYTAHGDTRQIKKQQGFSPLEVKSVLSNFKQQNCILKVWMTSEKNLWNLVEVSRGWPYLEVEMKNGNEQPASPNWVKQLRSGRFHSRHATTFKFDGQVYTLLLAIDGKRRALDEYKQLGRQRSSRSGIPLSSQQGVSLSSHGVKICAYNKLLDNQILSDFSVLKNCSDHFMFIIDGDFELITSRNQLAEKSKDLLSNTNFLNEIKQFLQDTLRQKDHILKELLQRLNRENTDEDENKAIQNFERKKESIIDTEERKRFHINQVELLKNRWFVSPIQGEEHFVGALYTLFSHIVSPNHKFHHLWKRALTFSGVGIDAIALDDENKDFYKDNLISLEYKYWFSLNDEFNHPLSMVNHIICWNFDDEIQLGNSIKASFDYVAQVTRFIEEKGVKIGLEIGEIRKKSSHNTIGGTVTVLSLERLLKVSFDIKWLV